MQLGMREQAVEREMIARSAQTIQRQSVEHERTNHEDSRRASRKRLGHQTHPEKPPVEDVGLGVTVDSAYEKRPIPTEVKNPSRTG